MRTTPMAAAVAAAAVLVLGGCGVGGEGGAGSSSAAKTGFDRDAVDGDLRKALAAAALDHGQGFTTAERGGRKSPDSVDWYGTVKTPDADKALSEIGASLERTGWKPDRERSKADMLVFRKSDWSLIASGIAGKELQNAPEGSSMLSVTASRLGE
ncbi:hypothetical protein [Streptomyces sp. enrichment culture]|uniref:hypothetical protein n=1 Tax=Streptomyces sp. enrichment culture TaxID=1795815 RepID=UPI003F55849C